MLPRLLLAVFFGTIILNIAIFSYDVLLIHNPPSGTLVTATCMLIAAGYALGALKRSILWKIMTSGPAVFLAIAGSWWLHLQTSDVTLLSPFFYYGYNWPWLQTLLVIILMTVPMATLCNLVSLVPRESE